MKKSSVILLFLFFGFYSCEKDLKSIHLDRSEITMHYNDTTQLIVTFSPSDADVQPVFIWSSDNLDVVTVDDTGFLKGVRIGETNVVVKTLDEKFQDSCKVFIEPISNLYLEPIYELGTSVSYIKSKVLRELLVENPNVLIYKGYTDNVTYVMYVFESDKLTSATVLLKEGLMAQATTFLSERYEFHETLNGVTYYRVNQSVLAGLGYDPKIGLTVTYVAHDEVHKSLVAEREFLSQQLSDLGRN
jgi:hypothetical protein